jgi:cysteinyl-tRNA synthetase
MTLKLYDSLARKERKFEPLDPANVRMYVCGPTVYDFAHIGNARPVIVFDVLFRLLRNIYGADHVTYVRNITDVDDKINARAAEEYSGLPLNEAIRKITERTEQQFHTDVDALGCLRPTFEPRATEYIDRQDAAMDMLRLIQRLIENQNAYVEQGHVLFDVSTMADYGMLVKQPLDELLSGARVDPLPFKRNPMDFVLWKPSKLDEPSWPSPWGDGRPGWHIECSAMSAALLGETFDIHGGGIDLLFPHHENEIAQSRCAFHTPSMANYWMHNGFLRVEGEKMSKSLGNFRTIADLRGDWQGEVIRYQMLLAHYRQPIDWTESSSREAQFIVDRWYELIRDLDDQPLVVESGHDKQFMQALSNDLDTPSALGRVNKLFQEAKTNPAAARSFVSAARLLGFFGKSPDEYFSFYRQVEGVLPRSSPDVPLEINKMRDVAKARRDFATADYIRNIIYLYGYRVVDTEAGGSRLIPATKDYFSVVPSTKVKLLRAVKLAMNIAIESGNSTSAEHGLMMKFGREFHYTPEYQEYLNDAFAALEHDIGAGAITAEDLNEVIVDVVISNLATPAKFGPDVVVSAILLKLLSGVVKPLDVYFENRVIGFPDEESWSLGSVSVVPRKVFLSRLTEKVSQSRLIDRVPDASSFFHVRMPATRTTLRDRAKILIRAFISAVRVLYLTASTHSEPSVRSELLAPPLGTLELDALVKQSQLEYFGMSDDDTVIFSGGRARFPYRINKEVSEEMRRSPLFAPLDQYVRFELRNPISAQLLALDRLTRARTSDDPLERLHWNLEAVHLMYSEDRTAAVSSEVLGRAISAKVADPGGVKRLQKVYETLVQLDSRIGLVTRSESERAQAFAEQVVAMLLSKDDEVTGA